MCWPRPRLLQIRCLSPPDGKPALHSSKRDYRKIFAPKYFTKTIHHSNDLPFQTGGDLSLRAVIPTRAHPNLGEVRAQVPLSDISDK